MAGPRPDYDCRNSMGAYEDLAEALRHTDAMQDALAALEREPVELLYAICREYEATSQPVPDHHLHISGYFKDLVLRVLLSGGLLERHPGSRLSIYSYKPTSAAMEYYRRLAKESWHPEKTTRPG